MKSDNEYEAAFDAFLRKRGVVVLVVEVRRSYLGDRHWVFARAWLHRAVSKARGDCA